MVIFFSILLSSEWFYNNLMNQLIHKDKKNDHSTYPDIVTGWSGNYIIPKLKQLPLIFANTNADLLSKSLTSFGSDNPCRVVYMGPRYVSNLKAYKILAANDIHSFVKQNCVYGEENIKRFSFMHLREKQKFFSIRTSEYRLFVGMNPTCHKQDIKFDSDFECGNLDLAVYVSPVEYDLLMRVDSNTKGHTNWFYFKVTNIVGQQKIKFNIINFGKKLGLYKEGMKPYVFRKSQKCWSQQGINVEFKKKKFRYSNESPSMYCLSFIYHFKDDDEVYFAYCVPYSYSYLLHFLNSMRVKYPQFLKIDLENQSTGGLPIPLVSISNFTTSQANKSYNLCVGRLHPGQSQGSWMMEGFIRYLCSPQANFIRDRVIFKIIPMINVDGVVLGNFRTGINGRDLNRSFCFPEKYLQVNLLRQLTKTYNPVVFLDFHGHSGKKNVFTYGPQYKLQDKDFLSSRILPKYISKLSPAFRYYSCSFKIPEIKNSTARAIMLREHNIRFFYTIQASTFAYGPLSSLSILNLEQFVEIGKKIGFALTDFTKFINILPKRFKNLETEEKRQVNNHTLSNQKVDFNLLLNDEQLSQDSKLIIQEIMKSNQNQLFDDDADQQNNSDFEDQEDDYTQSQLKDYFHQIQKGLGELKSHSPPPSSKLQGLKSNKNLHKKKKKIETSMQLDRTSQIKQFKQSIPSIHHNLSIEDMGDSNQQSNMVNLSNLQERQKKMKKLQSIKSKVSQYYQIVQSKTQAFRRQETDLLGKQLEKQQFGRLKNKVVYDWNGRSGSVAPKFINVNQINMGPTDQLKKDQSNEKYNKKFKGQLVRVQPMHSVINKNRKLPSLQHSGSCTFQDQKSLLCTILEEHQRKNKILYKKEIRIKYS